MTRAEAARALLKELRAKVSAWWTKESGRGEGGLFTTWAAAAGVPAVLTGFVLCPRLTVLGCAAVMAYVKIEERRKKG